MKLEDNEHYARYGLKVRDRVRVADGREGWLCWIIPKGTEAAVALDGEYGTWHTHPSNLTKVQP